MAEIALTKGIATIVDDDLFDWLSQWKWYAQEHAPGSRGRRFYVRRQANFEGRRTVFLLHRVVAGAPEGLLVDHVNGDTLDNRRANLRLATFRQNTVNAYRPPSATGFRGVRPPNPANGTYRFRANIRHDNKTVTVGWADTAEEAARLYDAAARRLHGEFARLNFPEEAAAC